ncbi:MAG: hypothetical protein MI810_02135, partial [Flavobacteriales bacterium]|nr:hypothetical protein [Flavobacteriales bacterium]
IKDELKLLLFHSYGSSLQNYRDDYADSYTRVSLEFLDNMKERYPHLNTSVSEFFIHTLCSWMFTIIGEIIAHEDVTHGEIEAFMKEYVAFSTAGWKAVLKA